jgi:hypothetical protein
MGAIQVSSWGKSAIGAAGIGALILSYGCGAVQAPAARAQAAPDAAANTPVVVACGPNQHALVRPSVVNGLAVSQVECVPVAPEAVQAPAAVRQAAPQRVSGFAPLEDARIVPASSPTYRSARPVPARQVIYDDDRPVRVEKKGRSVKKSAIIVGSSAGIGAGLGAAMGGKKGALIGAAIGGGGAAIWDQMTRNK